jgi:hypothetical protein
MRQTSDALALLPRRRRAMSRLLGSRGLLVVLIILSASASTTLAQDVIDVPVIFDNCPDGYAKLKVKKDRLIDLSFNPKNANPFQGTIVVTNDIKLRDARGKRLDRDDFFKKIENRSAVHVTYAVHKKSGKPVLDKNGNPKVEKLELKQ